MDTQTVGYGSREEPVSASSSFTNMVKQNAKMFLLIAGVAIIAIIILTVLWAKNEQHYGVLFSNIEDKDGGEIITQLAAMNIPYKFSSSGTSILIPEDKVYNTRLLLAQQGLPKGGVIGFELLDKESFGMSQFNEQINYQRALEGELARTISTIDVIDSARVHLAIPKSSVFIRERKQPTASITLSVKPSRSLSQMQIDAIVHLVASSVPELTSDKVNIVDQRGNLLTGGDDSFGNINSTQLEFTQRVEDRIRQRIERIVEPVAGKDNFNVQVSAEIDFSRQESTIETYDPNSNAANQSIRSRQTSENNQTNPYSEVGGVPGALSNQPVPRASAIIDGTGSDSADASMANSESKNQKTQTVQRSDTVNYELNRQIISSKTPEGRIKRLTVAVLVNYKRVDPTTLAQTANNTGNSNNTTPIYEEVSPDVLKKIEDLTRQSMGYSEQRGDTVSIASIQFNHSVEPVPDNIPFWKTPEFYDLALTISRYLILTVIFLILWRNILKPIWLKNKSRILPPEEVELPDDDLMDYDDDDLFDSNYSKIQRKVFDDNLEQQEYIREMVERDPRVMALIIRGWLNEEAEEEEEGNRR